MKAGIFSSRLAFLSATVAAASLLHSPLRAVIDQDSDGLSDVWEAAYGQGLSPNGDPDGDGATNAQEAAAGTDPQKTTSVLRVSDITTPESGRVRLRWPTISGKRYQLQASPDFSQWQNLLAPVVGDGNTAEVTLPLATTFFTGTATLSKWSGLSNAAAVSTIKAYAANGTPPTQIVALAVAETQQTNPDESYYGQWIRGWIVPPANGSYTFWIASDDSSELWLSTDASPANKQLIASVSGWTGEREWTKYPSQRSAAKTLQAGRAYYFEAFQFEYTGGDNLALAWTGPTLNPDKEIIAGRYVASSGESLAQRSAGGKLFFRVVAADADSDGDNVSDYEELLIGFDPNNATTVPRVNDWTSITNALNAPNVVTIGVAEGRAYESDGQKARYQFFRSGNVNPLTIRYTIGGTATTGSDYQPLSGVISLPVGRNTVTLEVLANSDVSIEPAETVIATLATDAAYQVGAPASATVTIDDAPDVLFVAQMRPSAGLRSGGFGTAALRMAGNKVFANFALAYSNLAAAPVEVQLFISTTGSGGSNVLTTAPAQIPLQRWEFNPAGGYTKDQIVAALENGQLYVRISSAASGTGEITGRFVREAGWQTMPTPPAPPALPGGPPTDGDAARFLTQATFGPNSADITRVKTLGYSAWLDEQFAKPVTRHLPYVQARRAEFRQRYPADGDNAGWHRPRNEAWWQYAVTAEDQLRQRMAFALSEIIVVSQESDLADDHEGMTAWYDMLCEQAFGNFRQLLEKTTLSPMMGYYLSMIRNRKPDPVTGSQPDENYAREIMQLFSIGLSQLHLDGTLRLDANGLPIPTYTQADIVGLAHVFTGWGPHYDAANPPRWSDGTVADRDGWFRYGWDPMRPMTAYDEFHDTAAKRIVGGVTVPAGQTTAQDLQLALDTIFNHPSVGPFIAKQLIQRFVTSNPSPSYVYRVASKFNDNGSGVRGDLKATLRAVLLDYEARSGDFLTDRAFGKQREPLLRLSHLFRAVGVVGPFADSGDTRLFLDYEYGLPFQVPLGSPSVFNFFQPGFIQQGAIAGAGLLSPEFQITSETTTISQANNQHSAIFWGIWNGETDGAGQDAPTMLRFDDLVALVKTNGTNQDPQTALVDRLDILLLNGRISTALRQQITDAYAALPDWYGYGDDRNRARVQLAVYLIFASPEYAIQK
jgi:uncharacterized protein (DUF1800 family)